VLVIIYIIVIGGKYWRTKEVRKDKEENNGFKKRFL